MDYIRNRSIIAAMIVLSVGMPRAGSGWYYNLTHDLILAAGGRDAREIRQKYHLQRILTQVNCNIGALTPPRLLAVLAPSMLGNTFVVKAHAAPTPFAAWLMRLGWLKAAYIYRDPRDALLSVMENGERAREKGRSNAFANLVDFEAALKFMQEYVRISESWLALDQVLHTRYEALVGQYDQESSRLRTYLGLPAGASPPLEALLQKVVDRYRPAAPPPGQKGLHFSHGKSGRFREKLTAEQQARLAEVFGPYLARLSYPI